MFENRVLTRIFVLTKYHSGDQTKESEMGWECSTYAGEDKCIQDLVRRPERRRPLRRPGSRWEDNIKLDVKLFWVVMDWKDLA